MATNPTGAGSSVELSIFRSWGKDNVIGHEIKIIKIINSLLQKSGVSFAQSNQRLFSHIPLVKAQLERQCWCMLTEHRTLQNATLCGI